MDLGKAGDRTHSLEGAFYLISCPITHLPASEPLDKGILPRGIGYGVGSVMLSSDISRYTRMTKCHRDT